MVTGEGNGSGENGIWGVIFGTIVAIVGFGLLIVGEAALLGSLLMSVLVIEILLCVGVAFIIIGCGIFGYYWLNKNTIIIDLKMAIQPKAKLSILATFVSVVIVVVIALWADATFNVLWTVIAVGALGGLVHEIVQSKGTAFIPAKSGAKDGGSQNNEDYLGGMVGIILGGAAGLLALSTTTGTVAAAATAANTTAVSVLAAATYSASNPIPISLIATVFASGIALKGISDSAAGSTANK